MFAAEVKKKKNEVYTHIHTMAETAIYMYIINEIYTHIHTMAETAICMYIINEVYTHIQCTIAETAICTHIHTIADKRDRGRCFPLKSRTRKMKYTHTYTQSQRQPYAHTYTQSQISETEEATADMLGFSGTPRRAAHADAKIKELEDILWKEKRHSKTMCVCVCMYVYIYIYIYIVEREAA
jgi:hypothetical protein